MLTRVFGARSDDGNLRVDRREFASTLEIGRASQDARSDIKGSDGASHLSGDNRQRDPRIYCKVSLTNKNCAVHHYCLAQQARLGSNAFFAFRDDLFARLIGHQAQTQISYEEQIADLRAQIDRVSRLDQERVEKQIKPLLQREATLEEVTSGLAKDLLIQGRNSLPASGSIATAPLLLPVETPSAPIVATPQTESESMRQSRESRKAMIL